MCCQESGEREATVSLLCPKAAPGEPKLRRVNESMLPLYAQANSSFKLEEFCNQKFHV